MASPRHRWSFSHRLFSRVPNEGGIMLAGLHIEGSLWVASTAIAHDVSSRGVGGALAVLTREGVWGSGRRPERDDDDLNRTC